MEIRSLQQTVDAVGRAADANMVAWEDVGSIAPRVAEQKDRLFELIHRGASVGDTRYDTVLGDVRELHTNLQALDASDQQLAQELAAASKDIARAHGLPVGSPASIPAGMDEVGMSDVAYKQAAERLTLGERVSEAVYQGGPFAMLTGIGYGGMALGSYGGTLPTIGVALGGAMTGAAAMLGSMTSKTVIRTRPVDVSANLLHLATEGGYRRPIGDAAHFERPKLQVGSTTTVNLFGTRMTSRTPDTYRYGNNDVLTRDVHRIVPRDSGRYVRLGHKVDMPKYVGLVDQIADQARRTAAEGTARSGRIQSSVLQADAASMELRRTLDDAAARRARDAGAQEYAALQHEQRIDRITDGGDPDALPAAAS